ncbi:MAG TPA: DUF3515 domain-containing protein, partial [Actinomycetes bacterium]|nr:DUF3515 domain-containing protein [Actinomycetes bacterium]
MRDLGRTRVALAAPLVLMACALAGCSNAVDVEPPPVDPEVAAVCADLIGALPSEVLDQPAVVTEPKSQQTAAWGDPPIVLRCGVAEPASFEPTSEVTAVNGVDWFPEQRDNEYVFTTWGRTVRVELKVPRDYTPAGAL